MFNEHYSASCHEPLQCFLFSPYHVQLLLPLRRYHMRGGSDDDPHPRSPRITFAQIQRSSQSETGTRHNDRSGSTVMSRGSGEEHSPGLASIRDNVKEATYDCVLAQGI
nr:hypothetical protein CFP56_59686 [Quercus suber]